MRRAATLLALAAVSAAAGPVTQNLRSGGPIVIDAQGGYGERAISLHADSVPLDRLLGELAERIDHDVEGLSPSGRTVLVTVDLETRPLEQVLEYVLGSVGMGYRLRPGTITVTDASTADSERSAVVQLASAAYLRALTRYPDHPLAPGARLEQAEVAVLQGYPGAAIGHYQALLEDYPKAPEVPTAYLRSGLLYQELGRWAEAAEQFRAVANIPLAKEHQAEARLELARCTVEIGDPQEALYMLAALEASHPADTDGELGRRELVRALALAGTGRFLEALRVVEGVETLLRGPDRIEGLRVRAIALQGAGHAAEAARAWMIYALETEEPARLFALEQAAQLALEAEDEMSALFIVRQAEELGHGPRFAEYETEAYERLGFATAEPAASVGMEERVASAERKLAGGDVAAATDLLADYVAGAAALEPELRVRFAAAWARCLAANASLDEALAHLRGERDALAGDVHRDRRARLDVAAAGLLESRELFDRAADAYRGIY